MPWTNASWKNWVFTFCRWPTVIKSAVALQRAAGANGWQFCVPNANGLDLNQGRYGDGGRGRLWVVLQEVWFRERRKKDDILGVEWEGYQWQWHMLDPIPLSPTQACPSFPWRCLLVWIQGDQLQSGGLSGGTQMLSSAAPPPNTTNSCAAEDGGGSVLAIRHIDKLPWLLFFKYRNRKMSLAGSNYRSRLLTIINQRSPQRWEAIAKPCWWSWPTHNQRHAFLCIGKFHWTIMANITHQMTLLHFFFVATNA